MNWFQHDTASTQDAKIKKLLIRHGAVGYAVYFHCLELIASDLSETNLTFELEHDSEIIADNLRIQGTGEKSGIQIVEEIMRTIVSLDLFSERNGHIFCFKLIKRINLSQTSKPAFRAAITNKRAELLPIMINHDPIMTHHDPIMTHHDPIMNTNQQYQPTIQNQAGKILKNPIHFIPLQMNQYRPVSRITAKRGTMPNSPGDVFFSCSFHPMTFPQSRPFTRRMMTTKSNRR